MQNNKQIHDGGPVQSKLTNYYNTRTTMKVFEEGMKNRVEHYYM